MTDAVILASALLIGFALAHFVDWAVPRAQNRYRRWRANRGNAPVTVQKPTRQMTRKMQRDHVKQLAEAAVRNGDKSRRRVRREAQRELVIQMRERGRASIQQQQEPTAATE